MVPHRGRTAFAGAAAVLLAACSFDSSVNDHYGCDGCDPPFECHLNYCVRPVQLEPEDAGWPDAARFDAHSDAAVGDAGRSPEDAGRTPDAGPCSAGQVEACYEGPDGTRDEGRCAAGRRTCRAGVWSACRDQRLPEDERCNGLDDDCDGSVDEDFDLSSDARHCGACDRACTNGSSCCEGACVDTGRDAEHCGGCGQRCDGDDACCDGVCADTQHDSEHCGASCAPCGTGQDCCDGVCVDLTSHQHCGACGNACDVESELCCQATCTTDLDLCAL